MCLVAKLSFKYLGPHFTNCSPRARTPQPFSFLQQKPAIRPPMRLGDASNAGSEWHCLESPRQDDPHLGNAETNTIAVADALKTIENDRKLRQAALGVPFPVVYLALFFYMVYVHIPSEELFQQSNALYTKLASKGDGMITADTPIQFYSIESPKDVFDWLENTLVPTLYDNETFAEYGYNFDKIYGRVATFNQILGGARFSVSFGTMGNCSNPKYLHDIYPVCRQQDSISSNPFFFGVYQNASDVILLMESYREENHWLGPLDTVSFVIDIVTYNAEVSAYAVTSLKLEYQNGGLVKPSATTISAKAIPYKRSEPYVVDILVGLCFLKDLYRQICELWSKDPQFLASLKTFWRFIDYSTTVLVVTFYVVWGIVVKITATDVKELLEQYHISKDTDIVKVLATITASLQKVANFTIALRLVATAATLCLGVRILESFRFHPRLNVLSKTVARSLSKFSAFFLVCFVIVVTFALSGHVIFGDRVEDFSNITHSLRTCINILFGTFNFAAMDGLLGPVAYVYYWIYMVVVTLVLLNMTLAIVLDTYDTVRRDAETTLTSMHRIAEDLFYEFLLWTRDHHCLRRAIMSSDSYVSHSQIVFRGRIRPDVLESAIQAIADSEPLTPHALRSMFSNADVTDAEAQATVKYLLDGVNQVANSAKADSKQAEGITKNDLLKSLHRVHDLQKSFTAEELKPLTYRISSIESKLEKIGALEHSIERKIAQMASLEQMVSIERKLDLLLAGMSRR